GGTAPSPTRRFGAQTATLISYSSGRPACGIVGRSIARPTPKPSGGRSMNFRTLVWEPLGAIVRITTNRPEVLNDMLTIPHRQALGTYGAEARAKGVKQRIETRDQRFGDTARRPS